MSVIRVIREIERALDNAGDLHFASKLLRRKYFPSANRTYTLSVRTIKESAPW